MPRSNPNFGGSSGTTLRKNGCCNSGLMILVSLTFAILSHCGHVQHLDYFSPENILSNSELYNV